MRPPILAQMSPVLCGCATGGPEEARVDESSKQQQDENACPSDDPGPNRDGLGRLVTGPGLRRLVGVSKTSGFSAETNVELELTYDGLGRPSEANAWFSPHCPSDGPMGDLIIERRKLLSIREARVYEPGSKGVSTWNPAQHARFLFFQGKVQDVSG